MWEGRREIELFFEGVLVCFSVFLGVLRALPKGKGKGRASASQMQKIEILVRNKAQEQDYEPGSRVVRMGSRGLEQKETKATKKTMSLYGRTT